MSGLYCIGGKIGGEFNLVDWWTTRSTAKLESAIFVSVYVCVFVCGCMFA